MLWTIWILIQFQISELETYAYGHNKSVTFASLVLSLKLGILLRSILRKIENYRFDTQYDTVRAKKTQYDPVRRSTTQYDPVRPSMTQYDPVWPSKN